MHRVRVTSEPVVDLDRHVTDVLAQLLLLMRLHPRIDQALFILRPPICVVVLSQSPSEGRDKCGGYFCESGCSCWYLREILSLHALGSQGGAQVLVPSCRTWNFTF